MKCLVSLVLMINLVFARKYERCELAKELNEKHDIRLENVGMLVCFAEYTSNLETEKDSYGSYGLFQLNGDWWCSKEDGIEDGCDMNCTDLIDDDITDDVKCIKQIISVQGLDAWGLNRQCLPKASEIVNQCFPNELHSGETQHVIVKDESEESVQHHENPDFQELFDVNSFVT